MSQKEQILSMLSDYRWHCTSSMYASFMADPRTILSKLLKDGVVNEPRWCQNPNHNHKGNMKEWQLNHLPAFTNETENEKWIREEYAARMQAKQKQITNSLF